MPFTNVEDPWVAQWNPVEGEVEWKMIQDFRVLEKASKKKHNDFWCKSLYDLNWLVSKSRRKEVLDLIG